MRLYIYPLAEGWAATVLTDEAPPPEPNSLRSIAFFAETSEAAERLALAYLGEGVAQN